MVLQMKFTKVDGSVFTTPAEVAAARAWARCEGLDWIESDDVERAVTLALRAWHDHSESIWDVQILGKPDIHIAMNHYKYTLWCECKVMYEVGAAYMFAEVHFDLYRALINEIIDAFVIEYMRTDSGCAHEVDMHK